MVTKYNLDLIVKDIEEVSNQKAVKDQIFNTTYLMGHITEDILLDLGFKYYGKSNKAGYETDVYKLGNIEAIYVEEILHIFEITA